jgi:hypothetical protein
MRMSLRLQSRDSMARSMPKICSSMALLCVDLYFAAELAKRIPNMAGSTLVQASRRCCQCYDMSAQVEPSTSRGTVTLPAKGCSSFLSPTCHTRSIVETLYFNVSSQSVERTIFKILIMKSVKLGPSGRFPHPSRVHLAASTSQLYQTEFSC